MDPGYLHVAAWPHVAAWLQEDNVKMTYLRMAAWPQEDALSFLFNLTDTVNFKSGWIALIAQLVLNKYINKFKTYIYIYIYTQL